MSRARVELGRHLFYDRRLSGNGEFSCADCHQQRRAFTDGRAQAEGATGQRHPRSSQGLANVAYNASYGWIDPSLLTLEQQIRVPLFNREPIELGVAGNEQAVLQRLRSDATYAELFPAAFPADVQPVTIERAIQATACFMRSLISGNSAYHRLLYRDEREALSPAARRGMRLFFSDRTGCASCHAGFNFSGPIRFHDEPEARPVFYDTGLGGRFRPPSLLNIAQTAPYMHDGRLATLDAVIDFYASGGERDSPGKSERIAGFEISPDERHDLVEFLRSLSDPGFVTDPAFSNPWP